MSLADSRIVSQSDLTGNPFTAKLKGKKMNTRLYIFVFVVLSLLWLVGCEVSDPGTALSNQAPSTSLTVAPLEGDTVNHLVALRWAGNDPDGEIVGFYLKIDDEAEYLVTATDTIIAFAAPD
jgi:hypothetical protein